ncbi:MAG: RHS repeat-associated core domain-containing protein [Clostridia bacterium]|nr:RHS repeat-associated core domain-containing protein [Clostridia bacterium]
MVVKYIYDAWGNHAVVDRNGEDIDDMNNIGNMNPFRYNGYYYDVETGFYYLKTRYYDPELGRFVSQDSIEYADPETINGLNLYAYCANNPVMNVDPNGTWSWKKFWNGVKRVVAGVVTVALAVGAVALTVVSGGIASPALAVVAQLGASILTGAAIGATLSLATQSNTNGDFDLKSFFVDIGVGAVSGAFSFGVGKLFSVIGAGIGTYINQITIKGLQVGKVFGSVLPKIFEKAGAFIGGISSGMFIDKFANILLGRQDSILDRFTNNFQGGIFSSILEFIKSIW